MSPVTDLNFNDISSEAMRSAGMGIFKKEYNNNRYIISNNELLGLGSNILSFDEFNNYASQDSIEPFIGGSSSDNDDLGLEKVFAFEVPGKIKIWIKTISFKKETTDKGEKIVWGVFRVLDNRKPDSAEAVDIFSNIIVRQKNISRFLSSFIENHDLDCTINNILMEILLLFGGSRCYIFEFDHKKVLQKLLYEVDAPGIAKENNWPPTIPLEATPYLNSMIRENKPLIISDISDYSKNDEKGSTILTEQKVKSLMIVPMPYSGGIKGYLGIDTLTEKRVWSVLEYQLLASFATMIGICMDYTGMLDMIHKLSFELEETNNRLKDSKNQFKEQDNNYLTFVSNISYEIRTQLNAIMGFANIMSIDEKKFSKENRYFLSVIRNNSENLLNMITSILNRIKPNRQTGGLVNGDKNETDRLSTKKELHNFDAKAETSNNNVDTLNDLNSLLSIVNSENSVVKKFGSNDKIENDPVILIVEDNESNFRLLSILLKQYAILWAEDGVTAIDIYNKHKPDLILMDIQLPCEDGLSATKRIREVDTQTPIIAITANAMDSVRKKAFDAGCNEFLVKPVNNQLLKEIIEKYLKSS